MAESGAALRFPDIKDIIQLNQRLIERYGGDFNGLDNLINRNSLEWVLDAIRYPFFGEDPYPTIAHKAAIIAGVINDGHVFYDGNKRTSMFAAALFLYGNGYQLLATNQEIVSIALAVAKKHETGITYEYLTQWFKDPIRSVS
ncbi:MAG: type II toxin-antitoxin system death-on-curing family toxin [Anaerolineales bacterium]|nr:type II toxin-antitoxin system death-on-curing family toxin [Anaerolineales bacterium]